MRAHRAAPGAGLAERGLWARRHAALRALRVVRDVFGAVEDAALAAARGGGGPARKRDPWDGQFVRLLGRGTMTPGRGAPHRVVHDLWPRAGP